MPAICPILDKIKWLSVMHRTCCQNKLAILTLVNLTGSYVLHLISIRKILTVINIFDRSFSLKCLVYICDPIKPYEKKNERSNLLSCFCFP